MNVNVHITVVGWRVFSASNGDFDGMSLGDDVGSFVSLATDGGFVVNVGLSVSIIGSGVDDGVGSSVGTSLGDFDGNVGSGVFIVGPGVGDGVGSSVGISLGNFDGAAEGNFVVGTLLGDLVGVFVGTFDGAFVVWTYSVGGNVYPELVSYDRITILVNVTFARGCGLEKYDELIHTLTLVLI